MSRSTRTTHTPSRTRSTRTTVKASGGVPTGERACQATRLLAKQAVAKTIKQAVIAVAKGVVGKAVVGKVVVAKGADTLSHAVQPLETLSSTLTEASHLRLLLYISPFFKMAQHLDLDVFCLPARLVPRVPTKTNQTKNTSRIQQKDV